jgi:hypothetical protein
MNYYLYDDKTEITYLIDIDDMNDFKNDKGICLLDDIIRFADELIYYHWKAYKDGEEITIEY